MPDLWKTRTYFRVRMTAKRIALAVGVIEKAYFANDNNGSGGWVSLQMEPPEAIALQLDDLALALKSGAN